MDIQPIRTEADYDAALTELDKLMEAEPGTPAYDKLEVLSILVEAYEEEHHRIPPPDPIAAIEFHMERLGLTRKDLEPYIGGRGRVSEVLNRKRPLTLRMIRNLEKGLGIGDDGDPFPGRRQRREFSPLTRPSSDSYDGDNTGVAVTGISDPGEVMTASFTVSLSGSIEPVQPAAIPAAFTLEQNYPNPFNPETIIAFNLQASAPDSLVIYDMLGRQIKELANGVYPAGEVEIRWNGTDSHGHPVASGVYLYELMTDSGTETKKMILVR